MIRAATSIGSKMTFREQNWELDGSREGTKTGKIANNMEILTWAEGVWEETVLIMVYWSLEMESKKEQIRKVKLICWSTSLAQTDVTYKIAKERGSSIGKRGAPSSSTEAWDSVARHAQDFQMNPDIYTPSCGATSKRSTAFPSCVCAADEFQTLLPHLHLLVLQYSTTMHCTAHVCLVLRWNCDGNRCAWIRRDHDQRSRTTRVKIKVRNAGKILTYSRLRRIAMDMNLRDIYFTVGKVYLLKASTVRWAWEKYVMLAKYMGIGLFVSFMVCGLHLIFYDLLMEYSKSVLLARMQRMWNKTKSK